ncbi:hypothetical protein CXG81DRAFT_27815 [Caulochytrium protostelioides]|uniref:S-adenosyl-L-methionine-dependent methyltransferase n=1 Tax=Caulochytrium protostelioides TaxID=1555241 RepID=A0A4P9X334_9FUNG|nr:hypothetical protein CXG81DRAFT_27815 [Caulochytrium protostelioides]|eukprot:RKO99422.1 hypothetical protein CXG81DRAFT_27815 [Caulochytrium protostelioides]
MATRPEHSAPPEIFYGETEAVKYTASTRVTSIQAEMTERALEIMNLPGPSFLLDIGCGSGLSGEILDENEHIWVGLDISSAMLDVALERESEGDLFLQDIGQGMAFRPGSFDGAVSISVIQWLCNADATTHEPRARLKRFFTTLYMALRRGARAVFQFYPEGPHQIDLITTAAHRAGFTGGVVVDYPNSSKARKYYLCLFAGSENVPLPAARTDPLADGMDVDGAPAAVGAGQVRHVERGRQRVLKGKGRAKGLTTAKTRRERILHKKALSRLRGKEGIPLDSKRTGKKRKDRF